MDTVLWEKVLELVQLRLRYYEAWQIVKLHAKAVGGDSLKKCEAYKSKCRQNLQEAQLKLDMMLHRAQKWDIVPKVPENIEGAFETNMTEAAAALLKLEGKAGEITGAW